MKLTDPTIDIRAEVINSTTLQPVTIILDSPVASGSSDLTLHRVHVTNAMTEVRGTTDASILVQNLGPSTVQITMYADDHAGGSVTTTTVLEANQIMFNHELKWPFKITGNSLSGDEAIVEIRTIG